MKTKPTYSGNILTGDLQALPNGTLFYEHVFDGLQDEVMLYKKVRTIEVSQFHPNGDVLVQPMTCSQYSEVPGEQCRLGYDNSSGKEWRVASREQVEKMVGWLMTTAQYFED